MLRRIMVVALIAFCVIFVLTGCENPVEMFSNWFRDNGHVPETPQAGDGYSMDEDMDGEAGPRMRDTVLYYRDSDGYLVPVSIDIEWEEGIARSAIIKLVSADKDSEIMQHTGLHSAIPPGTKVLGLTIRDGLAKLDLSAEALTCNDAEAERLMLRSLVYTLTEFNTVDRVQFMFEGDIIETLKFGTKVAKPIKREGINAINEGTGSMVTVFFHRANEIGYQYFVPVTFNTGIADVDMGIAMECLLEGPPEGSGLESFIPANTSISGMGIKNGIAYLNFEKGIFDYEGSDSIGENIVKSITLTLKEYPAVTGVVFLVEGQPAKLPTGVVLESVIDMPVFANEYN